MPNCRKVRLNWNTQYVTLLSNWVTKCYQCDLKYVCYEYLWTIVHTYFHKSFKRTVRFSLLYILKSEVAASGRRNQSIEMKDFHVTDFKYLIVILASDSLQVLKTLISTCIPMSSCFLICFFWRFSCANSSVGCNMWVKIPPF